MEEKNVYRDISQRTDGDIYIGVVGPVRTGKSTFIKRFMDSLVLPNIGDESVYQRTLDELPQSAAGKTIMTTEPKFIPEESVEVDLGDNVSFKVRMIDCVGYVVNSALGHTEEDGPRMVKTPWAEQAIPFDEAAEIGTKKVITDHSSIGLVITTDGSFSDIPREDYLSGERRDPQRFQKHVGVAERLGERLKREVSLLVLKGGDADHHDGDHREHEHPDDVGDGELFRFHFSPSFSAGEAITSKLALEKSKYSGA